MPNNKNHSKLSLEELLMEEKKIKRNEIITSFIIGFLVSIMIYGIAKKGIGFLHIFIPLILIREFYKNTQKLKEKRKQIQTAINAQNS